MSVAGIFCDEVSFGSSILAAQLSCDIFVARFQSQGSHIWSGGFGDDSFESARGITSLRGGETVVVGSFGGSISFGGAVLSSSAPSTSDAFLARLSAIGGHVWSKRLGDAQDDDLVAVAADESMTLVVGGHFEGAIDAGGGILNSAGQRDVLVARLSDDGEHLWSKRFGAAEEDLLSALALDQEGNVFVGGSFRQQVAFEGVELSSAGGADGFVVKLRR